MQDIRTHLEDSFIGFAVVEHHSAPLRVRVPHAQAQARQLAAHRPEGAYLEKHRQ